MQVTKPLCLTCGNPVDELTFALAGKKAKNCVTCDFTYTEKSENIPGGIHIWEESRTGNKRNDRLWWQGHHDQNCVQGLYVRMIRKGNSYEPKQEGQCATCARIYQYVPLDAQLHRSGAYWYTRDRYGHPHTTIWFPDCTKCVGGIALPRETSCTTCQKRFDEWVMSHDVSNVKWGVFGKVGETSLGENQNGWFHTWEPPAENGKSKLQKHYPLPDGTFFRLGFWEQNEKGGLWKGFSSREALLLYIKEKTGGNIRNHWLV